MPELLDGWLEPFGRLVERDRQAKVHAGFSAASFPHTSAIHIVIMTNYKLPNTPYGLRPLRQVSIAKYVCVIADAIIFTRSSRTSRAFPIILRTSAILAGLLHANHALAEQVTTPLVFVPYAFKTEQHGTIAAEVAYLEVPRRHSDPNGPSMRLRVVRLPATGGGSHMAPVVYLAGGPGGSGVGTARGPRWPVFDTVRRQTDVLLLDQRGTGLSEPPPDCPYTHRFDDDQPLQHDAALDVLRATALRCIAYWRMTGVDLAAYTTTESAHDIEDLRRAMALPRISLWGMSYGSHLALASIRLHAPGIERAVLIGTEGPDDTLKLPLEADVLLEKLGADAAKDGFQDLPGSARRILRTLRAHSGSGRSLLHHGRRVTIGEFDAQLAIAASLGRRTTQRLLPLALRDAENGNYDLLAGIVLTVREQLGQFSAMPLAMDVASGHSQDHGSIVAAQSRQSLFGDALNFPFPMLGDELALTVLGDDFRAPLHSKVPTLFISGTLDGRTPLANAQRLLAGFDHGSHLVVQDASHDDELWLGNPDIATRIAEFLAGHSVQDATIAVPPPRFATNKIDMLLMMLDINKRTALAALFATLSLPLAALAWHRHRRRRA
jgi:pimeloyl-ACP methyl ester carboxylesterase